MTQNPDDNFSPDMDMDETLRPFDVQEQSGRRAMVLLFIAFAILMIIALVLFNTYRSGVRDRDAPPVIAADKTPFKIKPENPGGEETPNQDKAIYDVMNGQTGDTAETVNTVNTAEDPMPMPTSEYVQTENDQGAVTATEAAKPAEPEVTSPPPVTTTSPAPAQSATPSSSSVVQVASVRTQSAAETLWAQLQADFPAVARSGLSSDIKRVDLGDRGVFYRLRVAGFADKAAASRLCDQFKAQGQACFVTSR